MKTLKKMHRYIYKLNEKLLTIHFDCFDSSRVKFKIEYRRYIADRTYIC